jgi:hypothetical protein
MALVAATAVAACEPAAEPLMAATCGPSAAMDRLTCTIRNSGKKASRACLRARVQPQEGAPLIGRRVCTKVIEPGQAAEVTPLFEQLGLRHPSDVLTGMCMVHGQWACKVDVVETSREMVEDVPKVR